MILVWNKAHLLKSSQFNANIKYNIAFMDSMCMECNQIIANTVHGRLTTIIWWYSHGVILPVKQKHSLSVSFSPTVASLSFVAPFKLRLSNVLIGTHTRHWKCTRRGNKLAPITHRIPTECQTTATTTITEERMLLLKKSDMNLLQINRTVL